MSFSISHEHHTKLVQLLAPGDHAAAAAQKTSGVSLQGWEDCTVVMRTDASLAAAHTFTADLEAATIAANDPPLTGDYAAVVYPDLSPDQTETAGDPVRLQATNATTKAILQGRIRTQYVGDYARLSWTVVGASGVNGQLEFILSNPARGEFADGLAGLEWQF